MIAKRRVKLALAWLCVAFGLWWGMAACCAALNAKSDNAVEMANSYAKGGSFPEKPHERLLIFGCLFCTLAAGPCFGAALGAAIGKEKFLPTLGIFVWPAIVMGYMLWTMP